MEPRGVFDIPRTSVTSVTSRISTLISLRLSNHLSVISSHAWPKDHAIGESMVKGCGENEAVRADGLDTNTVETGVQRKAEAQMASGIRWRYAQQGTNLHHGAYFEEEDPSFSRKSYIDGVAYLLMALPDDISSQEAATIREALPPSIRRHTSLRGEQDDRPIGWRSPPECRTALQRYVAHLVAIFVILLRLALAYASVVARVVASYERKYNISQEIATRGYVIATTVGRYSVTLSARICDMMEGRPGRALTSIAGWLIESIAYGIQDGIGQGLMVADANSRQPLVI